MRGPRGSAVLVAAVAAVTAGPVRGESRAIDMKRSKVTVHVGKAGVFSAFGDEHEVNAPIVSGKVDDGPRPSVELTIDAKAMTVLDPGLAAEKRAEVQKKMLSAEVLDVERHPEIRFRSTSVAPAGEGRWHVEGELELHGRKAPLKFDVTAGEGRVKGTALVRQKAFGIEPVSAGGGTVKVKDELRIDFDVVAGSAAP